MKTKISLLMKECGKDMLKCANAKGLCILSNEHNKVMHCIGWVTILNYFLLKILTCDFRIVLSSVEYILFIKLLLQLKQY